MLKVDDKVFLNFPNPADFSSYSTLSRFKFYLYYLGLLKISKIKKVYFYQLVTKFPNKNTGIQLKSILTNG